MLHLPDADHEESSPGASTLLISKLSCSLTSVAQAVALKPGALAHQAYGQSQVVEQFSCNYGLNPDFQDSIEVEGLAITGTGPDGEARIIELQRHRFFVATLFVPQLSSSPEQPHPLITRYLSAARAFQAMRRGG